MTKGKIPASVGLLTIDCTSPSSGISYYSGETALRLRG